jgi:hypothetical protein
LLDHVRLATQEEIDQIADKSDILPGKTQVLAKGNIRAVVRFPVEANPIIWGEGTTDRERIAFVYALEERMLGAGFDRYYCQVDAQDDKWQKVIENWGFQQVSPQPELRYLRIIK